MSEDYGNSRFGAHAHNNNFRDNKNSGLPGINSAEEEKLFLKWLVFSYIRDKKGEAKEREALGKLFTRRGELWYERELFHMLWNDENRELQANPEEYKACVAAVKDMDGDLNKRYKAKFSQIVSFVAAQKGHLERKLDEEDGKERPAWYKNWKSATAWEGIEGKD